MVSNTGIIREIVAESPPAMTDRVPFFAPSTPPETGASTKPALAPCRLEATLFAVAGLTVEVSTSTDPGLTPGSNCLTTSSKSWSAETQVRMTLQAAANCSGVPATRAPVSFEISSATLLVRFHTILKKPVFARCRAIGAPIAPRPMTPALIFLSMIFTRHHRLPRQF